ncbi:kinase-like protein [Panus rudis PR-1116 ss-1]|nr:kinase-like protein [Panus rudis PR-1116 ss-1]
MVGLFSKLSSAFKSTSSSTESHGAPSSTASSRHSAHIRHSIRGLPISNPVPTVDIVPGSMFVLPPRAAPRPPSGVPHSHMSVNDSHRPSSSVEDSEKGAHSSSAFSQVRTHLSTNPSSGDNPWNPEDDEDMCDPDGIFSNGGFRDQSTPIDSLIAQPSLSLGAVGGSTPTQRKRKPSSRTIDSATSSPGTYRPSPRRASRRTSLHSTPSSGDEMQTDDPIRPPHFSAISEYSDEDNDSEHDEHSGSSSPQYRDFNFHVADRQETTSEFSHLTWRPLEFRPEIKGLYSITVFADGTHLLTPVLNIPETEHDARHGGMHSAEDYHKMRITQTTYPGRDFDLRTFLPPSTHPPPIPPRTTGQNHGRCDEEPATQKMTGSDQMADIAAVPPSMRLPADPEADQQRYWDVPQLTRIDLGSPSVSRKTWVTGSIAGEGAYGRVYHVLHVATRTEQAMKVVYVQSKIRSFLAEGLANELRVLKRFADMRTTCPTAFVTFPSFVEDQFAWYSPKTGFLHILMDFCPGGDLHQYIQKLDSDSLQLAAAEMICGIEFLHSLNIVHHDIKPENILVDKGGHCLITDFGGAKFMTEGKIKRKGHIICTTNFAAPELLECTAHYTGAVDWWSLGVTIFSLAVGQPLFSDKPDDTKREQRSAQQRLQSYFHPSGCERYLYEMLSKLLVYDPADRWTGARLRRCHPYFSNLKYHWEALNRRELIPPIRHVQRRAGRAHGFTLDVRKPDRSVSGPHVSFLEKLSHDGYRLASLDVYDVEHEHEMITGSSSPLNQL